MASEELYDWRVGLSLRERQKFMFEGQYGCDVTFLVGQGKSQRLISSHRYVLICGSSVFEELLERRQASEKEPIVVVDIEPSVFQIMIAFLYCEEVHITADNAVPLLVASKKYQVSQLSDKCVQFLKDSVSEENVCVMLNESLKNDEPELQAKCMAIINDHARELILSDNFAMLTIDSLMKLVQSDHIYGVKESEIYSACLKWAQEQCKSQSKEMNDSNIRAVLGDALYQIRFTAMSAAEFCQLTVSSSVLTQDERLFILDHIISHEKSPKEASYTKFNTIVRKPTGITNGTLEREPKTKHNRARKEKTVGASEAKLLCESTVSLEGETEGRQAFEPKVILVCEPERNLKGDLSKELGGIVDCEHEKGLKRGRAGNLDCETEEKTKCKFEGSSGCESEVSSDSETEESSECVSKGNLECESEGSPECESEENPECDSEERSECDSEERLECGYEERSECDSEERSECESEERSECDSEERLECDSEERSECESEERSECDSEERSECDSEERSECESEDSSECESD